MGTPVQIRAAALNIFAATSVLYGTVMALKWVPIHLAPRSWERFELTVAYPEKQPGWLWYVAAAGLVLIAALWHAQLTRPIPYSWIIVALVSLTSLKLSQVLFNYDGFRRFAVRATVTDRWLMVAMNVVIALAGLALLWLGFFVY